MIGLLHRLQNMRARRVIAQRSRSKFAQSTPCFEGSICSRRGNPFPRAISVQCRSTRSTSRRLNTSFAVSENMVDISSVSGNIAASTTSFSVALLRIAWNEYSLCECCDCALKLCRRLALSSVNIDLAGRTRPRVLAGLPWAEPG